MKKKILFISSTLLTGIAICYYFSSSLIDAPAANYKSKELKSIKKQSANDAQEWLKARYIDVTTGLPVTQATLDEIQKQISLMPKSKAINFIEQGPDNIGGRTRAIQVDRNNENRVWAGGVSGGLFVSLNGGNTWNRVDEYIDAGASPNISSMTQTPDGTFYVATGSNQEGWSGNNRNNFLFNVLVLEAKKDLISPLVGKEQARGYAKSLNCRFVILSNGVSHYFWDIEQGSPTVIDIFPSQEQLELRKTTFNPPRQEVEKIDVNYIAHTQLPKFDKHPDYLDERKK